MPVISINLDYLVSLGSMPFPRLLWEIFWHNFGWVPVLVVLTQGSWMLWKKSRQEKFGATLKWCLLAIDIPKNNEQTPKAAEQIFATISGAYSPSDWFQTTWGGKFTPSFSFEIVSSDGYVQYLVHCCTKYRDLVESAIYAQYPEAEIHEVQDYAAGLPKHFPDPEWDATGAEYVLKKDQAYPIRTYDEFEHQAAEVMTFKDPMSAVLEAMSGLKRGENLWLQIRVTPCDDSWQKKGEELVDKILGKKKVHKPGMLEELASAPKWLATEVASQAIGWGGADAHKETKPEQPKMQSMSPGEKKVLELVQEKLSKVGFMTKIRMVYIARRDVFNRGRTTQLKGAFVQFSATNMNGFKGYGPVIPKGDYFWQRWSENEKKSAIVSNYVKRSGKGATPYALNIEELATIYHFPMMTVKAPLVKKTDSKRAEPPSSLPSEGRWPSVEISVAKQEKKTPGDADHDGLPDNLPFG